MLDRPDELSGVMGSCPGEATFIVANGCRRRSRGVTPRQTKTATRYSLPREKPMAASSSLVFCWSIAARCEYREQWIYAAGKSSFVGFFSFWIT